MTRTRLIAIALGVLVAAATPFAHPDHKILGTVTMAASDHVMLTGRDGKPYTVKVVKTTQVTRDKKAMKAEDIPVGARIVATVVSDEDLTAKTIEVGAITKTSGATDTDAR